MPHPTPDEHGPSLVLARGEAGTVSLCACGVVTLTLQVISVRFEADAFQDLHRLVTVAAHNLARSTEVDSPQAPALPVADEGTSLH